MRKFILALWLVCVGPYVATAKVYPLEATHNAQVPEWLEEALTRHESRLNPYALNINGRSHYPATRADALILLHDAMQKGVGSIDIGLWQINCWWWGHFEIEPEDLLDPAYNELWGRWILSDEISRHGLTWKAVGKYHSPDDEKGRAYAWRIFQAADQKKVRAWLEGQQNAKQEKTLRHIPNGRGIYESEGECRPGRIVNFKISTPDQLGATGEKP